jgi:ketosteroid isomerase-like protein
LLYDAPVPTPIEEAILAANRAFYTAFNDRDPKAMEQLWATEHRASCIHPGWAPLVGRDNVVESWRAILGSPGSPEIAVTDAHVVMVSDAAFVTCIEHLPAGTVAATNVFVNERGEWRMVHHHGGPMPTPRASRRAPSNHMN